MRKAYGWRRQFSVKAKPVRTGRPSAREPSGAHEFQLQLATSSATSWPDTARVSAAPPRINSSLRAMTVATASAPTAPAADPAAIRYASSPTPGSDSAPGPRPTNDRPYAQASANPVQIAPSLRLTAELVSLHSAWALPAATADAYARAGEIAPRVSEPPAQAASAKTLAYSPNPNYDARRASVGLRRAAFAAG